MPFHICHIFRFFPSVHSYSHVFDDGHLGEMPCRTLHTHKVGVPCARLYALEAMYYSKIPFHTIHMSVMGALCAWPWHDGLNSVSIERLLLHNSKLHLYNSPKWTVFVCSFKSLLFAYDLWQKSHWYLRFKWTLFVCSIKYRSWLNALPHMLHWKFLHGVFSPSEIKTK